MADLQACFEGLGFKNVKTFLQSGNVLFESGAADIAGLRQKLETGVGESFSYPARIFVYSLGWVREAASKYPFDASDEYFQHYVIFIEPDLADDLVSDIVVSDPAIETFQTGDSVVYWRVQKGMTLKASSSKYMAKPKYKNAMTIRNLKTLHKITSV